MSLHQTVRVRTREVSGRPTSAADFWSECRLEQGKGTAVVALDIEGAFDRVWNEALVTKLHVAVIDILPLLLLKDYLNDRYLKVAVRGGKSELQPISAGLPEESKLGPLF